MRRRWAAVIRWYDRDEAASRHWTRRAAARAAAHTHVALSETYWPFPPAVVVMDREALAASAGRPPLRKADR